MKVKVSAERSVAASGKVFVAGQTLDLPNDRAKRLVELGYVTKVKAAKPTKQ